MFSLFSIISDRKREREGESRGRKFYSFGD